MRIKNMLSPKKSLSILKRTNALLEGHFVLSSGLHSSKYIQCAKLLSFPHIANKICQALSKKIKKNFKKIDVILSPAIGGIVVGYEVGRQLGLETIFAERLNGKLVLRRGFEIPQNSNVLIVEDVITTGKSALECSEIITGNKSKIAGYACIIDRTDNKNLIEGNIVAQIKFKFETFNVNELPDELKKIQPIKPGSRNLSQ